MFDSTYDTDTWSALLPKIKEERAARLEAVASGHIDVARYQEWLGGIKALDWVMTTAREMNKKSEDAS